MADEPVQWKPHGRVFDYGRGRRVTLGEFRVLTAALPDDTPISVLVEDLSRALGHAWMDAEDGVSLEPPEVSGEGHALMFWTRIHLETAKAEPEAVDGSSVRDLQEILEVALALARDLGAKEESDGG